MSRYTAYVICGTPRSGSTLLCEMLSASGVAGRPNSYFREQDVDFWAGRWGLPRRQDIEGPQFDQLYLEAMHREGSAGTGILAYA